MNDLITPEEARKRADEQRRAFDQSMHAVSKRLEHGADTVHRAMVRVTDAAASGKGFIERHPRVFVAAAVGVGLAIGAARSRRPRALSSGEVAQAPPRSALRAVAGFVGKALLRSIFAAAERAVEDQINSSKKR